MERELETALRGADCACVVTRHGEYRTADWPRLAALMRRPIVDRRAQPGVGSPARAAGLRWRSLGVGERRPSAERVTTKGWRKYINLTSSIPAASRLYLTRGRAWAAGGRGGSEGMATHEGRKEAERPEPFCAFSRMRVVRRGEREIVDYSGQDYREFWKGTGKEILHRHRDRADPQPGEPAHAVARRLVPGPRLRLRADRAGLLPRGPPDRAGRLRAGEPAGGPAPLRRPAERPLRGRRCLPAAFPGRAPSRAAWPSGCSST